MPNRLYISAGRINNSESPVASTSSGSTIRQSGVGGSNIPHVVSMVSRVQEKVEDLRRTFDLPPDEVFMDEFYCTLHKKTSLFQGRMYVFENYICFYSNLFGWVKKKVIPFMEVIEISKKRNYGFPNSVRIGWNGKKEFFSSFLSRDDTYNLLYNAWSQVQPSRRSSDPGVIGLEETPIQQEEARRRSEPCFQLDVDGESNEEPPHAEPSSPAQKLLHKRAKSEGAQKAHRHARRTDSLDKQKSVNLDAHDSDLEEEEDDYDDEGEDWTIEPGNPPPISEKMECLYKEDFNLSVREFFNGVFADGAVFFEEFHQARGDQVYQLSSWQKHSCVSGRVRHATYIAPVKSRVRLGLITPTKTECNQNQRFCVYEGGHLVFESSQMMKDIPYGDYFKVEMRWDLVPLENGDSGTGGCHLEIHAEVSFIRRVLSPVRLMIETSVMKEVRGSTEKAASLLQEIFADRTPETSVSDVSGDETDGRDAEIPEGFEEFLNRKDFRQWMVSLIQDEFGAVPGDAGSLSSQRVNVQTGVDSGKTSASGGNRRKLLTAVNIPEDTPWHKKFAAKVWSPIEEGPVSSSVLLIFLIVVFVLQIISMVSWLYPSSRCGGVSQDMFMAAPNMDRKQWVSYSSAFQEEVKGVQVKLDELVNAVNVGIKHIADAMTQNKTL